MLYNFAFIFMLFISVSFFGKIGETIFHSLYYKKKLASRGYLIGPYIPVYGLGALLLESALIKFNSSPAMTFLGGILLCSTVEYLVSYLLEKIFKARWWDYSDEKFNINGRICLLFSLFFGLFSLIYIYFFDPFYRSFLKSINHNFLILVSIIILLVFVSDVIISTMTAIYLKQKGKLKSIDCTEDVKSEVRRMIFGINKRIQ